MIENIKDLEKLLKICRKQGVQEIDLGTIKFKLGELPVDIKPAEEPEAYSNGPTDEELAMYSVQVSN